jgi:RNA polymerase sigma factor (TIGR02999 family)
MGSQGLHPEDRSHFFALAARAMRQVLIDYVRVRLAAKRGGGAPHTSLEGRDIAVEDRAAELLDLDAALERLHGVDERLGRLVELRFFAGLSVEETAELLGMSPRTVKRDWQKARALLYDDLHGDDDA